MEKDDPMLIKKGSRFNIIIVGLGGTGSFLVSSLLQMIGSSQQLCSSVSITLVDGDIVETRNLANQKYLPEDVGSYKSEALYKRYQDVYPEINLTYVPHYIENKKQLEALLQSDPKTYTPPSISVLVGCVDNIKVRQIMESLHDSRDYGLDFIYIDTGNGSGKDLTGQTVVSRSVHIKESRFIEGSFRKIDEFQEILPRSSFYFPHILEEKEETPTPSCGDIDPSTIQNIGANILSSTVVFNVLNGIINFNIIPGRLFTFDAQSLFINKSL